GAGPGPRLRGGTCRGGRTAGALGAVPGVGGVVLARGGGRGTGPTAWLPRALGPVIGQGTGGAARGRPAEGAGAERRLLGAQPGADGLRALPLSGSADHEQSDRIDRQAVQPPCERDGEVVGGAGSGGDSATARGLPL